MEPSVEDGNEFAISLYRQLRQRRANLFFSPFSIRTALAMAREGAGGDTAAQMNIALRLSTTDDELHVHLAGIRRASTPAAGAYMKWRWPMHSGLRMAGHCNLDSSI